MSEQFMAAIAADLAPAFDAIAVEAERRAQVRATEVARVSGGAVQTTPDQLAAIKSKASDELFDELRVELRDVANVFVLNLNPQPQGNTAA